MPDTFASLGVPNAFADFDPLCARLAPAPPPLPAELRRTPQESECPLEPPARPRESTRRGRRRRNVGAPSSGTQPIISAGPSAPAPWDVNPEAEAAERREDARKALREAIKAKRDGRTGRHALQAKASHEDGAGVADGANGAASLASLDAKTLQSLMKAAGVGGDAAPSMRQLRRRMEAMGSAPDAFLASRAAAMAKRG
jgi:hypothetical protein